MLYAGRGRRKAFRFYPLRGMMAKLFYTMQAA
jgi:hypothetical protein